MVTYPEDWREEKIEDIFSVITDYVAAGSFADLSQNVVYLKSPDYAQLVRTKDIKSKFTNNDFVYISKSAYEYLWRVHFDKPIIIMPNIGNCGEVYYLEPHMLPYKNSALGPNAIMLKKTTHDMKFLSYALERDDFQSSLADITSPSGQTKFNKTALAKISIVIPECFSEQQAIASVLSDFDEHIDNLSELIEKKKAIRDGALEELFSGAVRLAGFDDEWVEKTLEDIAMPNGLVRGPFGGSLKKESFVSKGNKVYEQRNAIYKSIKIGDYYVTDEKYNELSRFAVKEDDFIVSCSGTIGKIYKIPKQYERGIINQALLKISIDKTKCDLDYFYKYFEWDKFQDNIIDNTQGGAMKNLVGMEVFRNTLILMPEDINEQKAIAQIIIAMDEEIEALKIEMEKIIQIREGAMDDLLTGRVRLKI